jgi:heme oxygenase
MLTEILREQTREQHDQLEAGNSLPRTTTEYVTQLAMFFGFIEPWERALAHTLPDDDPIRRGRSKSSWLEQDLEFHGVDAAQRERLPRTSRLPSISSRAEILGAAYVLEGSTLGGQVISRHLEKTLGLSNGEGYRYFSSYGPQVGLQWRAFRDELLRASSPANDPVIIHAARETFAILYRWFSQKHQVRL